MKVATIKNEVERKKFTPKLTTLLKVEEDYTQKELAKNTGISKESWCKFLTINEIEPAYKDRNLHFYNGEKIINALNGVKQDAV